MPKIALSFRRTAALALATQLFAATAFSAGFEVPGNSAGGIGRGMAWTSGVDDGTALSFNPGALTRQKGLNVTYQHQLLWDNVSFTRGKSAVTQDDIAGTQASEALQKSSNQSALFPLGAMLVASHDFGLRDWVFAIGGYGPSSSGYKEFNTQGGQRYMLTKLDALMAYLSVSAAYGKDDKFGVGATLQWASMPKTNMSLVIDASTGSQQSPYYGPNDVVATIRLKDTSGSFSAILGGWWRPIKNLELAASGRIIPVNFHATGDVVMDNDKAGAGAQFGSRELSITDSKAALDMKLAPTASFAVRYLHLNPAGKTTWDVEADAVWEGWRVLNDFTVQTSGQINLFSAQNMPTVSIPKRWQDTWSVRLGGTAEVAENLRVSAGGLWEQGAAPLNYSNLDFPSFDRYGFGLGARYQHGNLLASLGYSHIFQESRTITEQYGKVDTQRPLLPCPAGCAGNSAIPANTGTFDGGYDLVSWTIGYRFGGPATPSPAVVPAAIPASLPDPVALPAPVTAPVAAPAP